MEADTYSEATKILSYHTDFIYHFVNNPYFELIGPPSNTKYTVEYIEPNGNILYKNTISTNNWIKLNKEYFSNYTIKVWEDDKLIFLEITLLQIRNSFSFACLNYVFSCF